MNIGVIGAGYVGLVMAAGLAELKHNVLCIESENSKLSNLSNGLCPFFEPGLEELLQSGLRNKSLRFSPDIQDAVGDCELIFISVGTPSMSDGSADISAVIHVARIIGQFALKPLVVAVKSTVPVGTCAHLEEVIQHEIRSRNLELKIAVVSNPEFLREGNALTDFRHPDRVVIGASSLDPAQTVICAYSQILSESTQLLVVSRESAELGKYASNIMLATRISLMNELSRFAESTGADIEQVRLIVGSDKRIGQGHLAAGLGFGGSCFPKDLSALVSLAEELSIDSEIVRAVVAVNSRQRALVIEKLKSNLGNLKDKKIAIWGLSYKPDTDDIRESPAISLIRALTVEQASVSVFDPAVRTFGNDSDNFVEFAKSPYDAVECADALVLVTEWSEFQNPDFERLSLLMRTRLIIDGRNIWMSADLTELDFRYFGIGRPQTNHR